MSDTRYTPPVFPAFATVTGAAINAGLDAYAAAMAAGQINAGRFSDRFRLPNTKMALPKSISALTWNIDWIAGSIGIVSSSAVMAPVVLDAPWDLLEIQLSVESFAGYVGTDYVSVRLFTDAECTQEVGNGTLTWPFVLQGTTGRFLCTTMRPAGGAGTQTVQLAKGTTLYLQVSWVITGNGAAIGFARRVSATLWKAARHGR